VHVILPMDCLDQFASSGLRVGLEGEGLQWVGIRNIRDQSVNAHCTGLLGIGQPQKVAAASRSPKAQNVSIWID
jgi:hypothetical protein